MSSKLSARVRRTGVALLFTAMGSAAFGQTLSLDEVLSRAANADPSIAATSAHLDAAQAGVAQAGVRPNPTVAVDVENFAGTNGLYSTPAQSQTTLTYERLWESRTKREARIGAARSELGVAAERGRVRSLDFLEKVETAWVEALAADALIGGAEEHLRVSRASLSEVERRVGAALDPLFAAQRARTEVAQAKIARDQAVENARIARATLARYWGGDGSYQLDLSAFERTGEGQAAPPSTAEVSPDLALLSAQRDAAERRVQMEESKNVADPTLIGGVRHISQNNDFALVVGASLPLGTKRANKANVERARAEQGAAEAELAVTRFERDREMAGLVANRAAILTEVRRIDQEILPSARRTVSLVNDGLRRGGLAFTYLEAASASQIVVQARTRRVELLRRYHLEGVRLDRLTGRFASFLSSAEKR